MEIKVLGAGCSKCEDLTVLVKEVVKVMNVPANVIHVTDLDEIMNAGIMMTPALIINEKTKCVGRSPSADEIKRWISEADK